MTSLGFSIVMPAFNAATTVAAAIESVLGQTRHDFELLVVDDGSSDDTAARVERYLGDDRVRLISQPNLGVSRARNTAIDVAQGRCISLLDSDDLWLPQYLEEMGTTLEGDPSAAVAYTDAWVLDDGSRRIAREKAMSPFHPPTAPTEPDSFLRALLRNGNFVFVGATFRTSTIRAVGAFRPELHFAEDYELWLRIAAHGHRFVRCPEPLAVYRRRPGQPSAQGGKMRAGLDEVFRIVEEEYDVPDDIRHLARQRVPLARLFGPQRHSKLPRPLESLYKALSRQRRYYFRPPRELRAVLPYLRSL